MDRPVCLALFLLISGVNAEVRFRTNIASGLLYINLNRSDSFEGSTDFCRSYGAELPLVETGNDKNILTSLITDRQSAWIRINRVTAEEIRMKTSPIECQNECCVITVNDKKSEVLDSDCDSKHLQVCEINVSKLMIASRMRTMIQQVNRMQEELSIYLNRGNTDDVAVASEKITTSVPAYMRELDDIVLTAMLNKFTLPFVKFPESLPPTQEHRITKTQAVSEKTTSAVKYNNTVFLVVITVIVFLLSAVILFRLTRCYVSFTRRRLV